ncbi:type 1 glutamine amidotransferase [Actinotalea ferrariae]|uniref:type 1 glutamine amidotransferase n=1 Tax=Actinotalea ferrariae TaxID=1386098 RepID=UPI0027E1FBFA|nr:type 1 glutamine amidotransferase [Actinotalea ferrariae]
MILTVIEHMASCPLDRFAGWLAETQPLEIRTVRAWAGDAIPSVDEVGDGLLVLGGQGNAYDDAGSPWLPATRALLAAAATAGVPTLGICLGAQLLAVATGGRVQVAAPPGRETGVIDVHPRPDAARDQLVGHLAADVPADHPLAGGVLLAMPSMHADAVVDLPDGAVWLASSRLYPYQAFRVGEAAWGLQFHPEASRATFAAWAEELADVDAVAALAEYDARADQVEAGGRAVAHRFAELVRRRHAGLPLAAEPALLP